MFLMPPDRSQAVLRCDGPDCAETISLNCQGLEKSEARQKLQLKAWQMGWHIIQTTIGHYCPTCIRSPRLSTHLTPKPSSSAPSPVGSGSDVAS